MITREMIVNLREQTSKRRKEVPLIVMQMVNEHFMRQPDSYFEPSIKHLALTFTIT